MYSEGASFAIRDVDEATRNKLAEDEFAFDLFLKKQIRQELTKNKLEPNSVFFHDTQNPVRSVPANAFDTKLCWYFPLYSVKLQSAASKASCAGTPISGLATCGTGWP